MLNITSGMPANFNRQTALLELIHSRMYITDCFIKMLIVLLKYSDLLQRAALTGKVSHPYCNSLPIMLELYLMLQVPIMLKIMPSQSTGPNYNHCCSNLNIIWPYW